MKYFLLDTFEILLLSTLIILCQYPVAAFIWFMFHFGRIASERI